MNNIQSTSVLVQTLRGDILLIVNKNKLKFDSAVNVKDEVYYKIGSSLDIGGTEHTIADIQLIYRKHMGDFQVVILVN